uniref:NADH-ubiquinone oxidoreductase chain 2 n=1 Tax=Proisotoma minuta TaxID=301521 RepID=A0A8K1M452_9HEXA|nr:NADH dehydrogenase subunit 2 [Proisotoma minuta]
MFMKFSSLTFTTTLMAGTMIALTSNSWLTAWAGLEINLMSMIPLLLKSPSKSATEGAIKYFLPQAMASVILITSFMAIYFTSKPLMMEALPHLILLSLMMKLGAAPLHYWFPQVLSKTPWGQTLLLLTWQKIAPFTLMMYFNMNTLTTFFIIASSVTGALGGLNQTNLKLILTYSSIAHTGWMLPLSAVSSKMWLNYFILYFMNSVLLVSILKSFKITNMKQLGTSSMGTPQLMFTVAPILSLGGLPPMMGFYAKLTALIFLLKSKMGPMLLIMLSSSLVSLFYYLKMTYSLLMMKSLRMNMNPVKLSIKENYLFTVLTFGILMTPALSTLI